MGVLLHNENKLDEMSKILCHLMKFVPTLPKEGTLSLPNGSQLTFDATEFFPILIGGDQLTAARIRGTQALRVTEDKAVDRLQGLLPVVEDWHARMSLVDVSGVEGGGGGGGGGGKIMGLWNNFITQANPNFQSGIINCRNKAHGMCVTTEVASMGECDL